MRRPARTTPRAPTPAPGRQPATRRHLPQPVYLASPPPVVSDRPAAWQVPAADSAGTAASWTLPARYGHTTIVLLVRDPWWLFTYWEVTPDTEAAVRQHLPLQEREGAVSILRVYDVTDTEGALAGAPAFDITLRDLADNWYIHVGRPDRAWLVEIGLRTPGGRFHPLARSNRVRTPRHGPADVIDEQWMSVEEEYWKLFGVAGGFGVGRSSMEIRRRFRQQLQRGLFSGGISSYGVSRIQQVLTATSPAAAAQPTLTSPAV